MPISFMTSRYRLFALVALAALPGVLAAQETSAKEEERLSQLSRGDGLWYTPKTRVSIGIRILNSGGNVQFGNLGSVPFTNELVAPSAGAAVRSYNDGEIRLDGIRNEEKDADGKQTSTPGGRYKVYETVTVNETDSAGNVTGTKTIQQLVGEYLAYTPGLTREWEVFGQSQFLTKPGYVAMNHYAAVSAGASATKEQGVTGGIELQYSREIGRGTRHFKWGVVAGISLNDINSKTSGSVISNLRTLTDFYSTGGLTIPLSQLVNPSFDATVDLDADGLIDGFENTVPLPVAPVAGLTTDVLTPGGANVSGRWQVKGAYFLMKFGPTLRTQITDTLGLSASFGFAGAYTGTRYTAYESFEVAPMPGVLLETTDAESGTTTVSSTKSKMLTGYFADLSLDWDVNDRFGLFGGVTAQQLDSYQQRLGERTAEIDLGQAVGMRGGVTIRF